MPNIDKDCTRVAPEEEFKANKTFTQRIEELKKGCKKIECCSDPNCLHQCGDETWLCPNCRIIIKALQEGYEMGYQSGLKQRVVGYISKKEIEDVLDNRRLLIIETQNNLIKSDKDYWKIYNGLSERITEIVKLKQSLKLV
jgi:hypothetical protein